MAPDDDRHRLLVLAGASVEATDLREGLAGRAADCEIQVHVVSPAFTESALRHGMGDVDEAIETARGRLSHSVEQIRQAGIEVTGDVGDSDPMLAIQDALQTFPADEILIVTHPDEEAAWLEEDAFDRARQTFSQPIAHLVVDDSGGGHDAVEVETAPAGTEEPLDEEAGSRSGNLPPLSVRDMSGIGVAIVGTIILGILAASCDYGEASTGCVVRFLLAVGVALISLAHVVGLLLFESTRYRGLGERFFANLVLWGMPVAIAVSLVVG